MPLNPLHIPLEIIPLKVNYVVVCKDEINVGVYNKF